MHTCRCGPDASSSGLTGRVATTSVRMEQNDVHNAGMGGFSMLADLDQSVEGLEMECTALKKACVACQDDGAKNTVQATTNAFAGLKMTSVEGARRWGNGGGGVCAGG